MSESRPGADFDRLLREQRVVICCGSGGVGKTTVSASLAFQAALSGRKAVVCTIDPARRLANSLGLGELGNEVVEVARERFTDVGLEPKGSLHALMLDTKGTFDKLIGRYAKSEEARQRILANKFYHQMSSTVVGSSDFMAMEKLYELHEQGEFDLIVLDTPPTKHALDFLQAPQRMREAFDQSSLEVFLKPWTDAGKRSFGFIGRAMNRVVRKVDQVMGLTFVEDLADFFRAFEGMYDGFRGRAQKVDALMREPFTSFVVVSSPSPLPLQEASFFCERLREFELPLAGVILNRVHESGLSDPALRERVRARLREDGPRPMLASAEAAALEAAGAEPLPAVLGPLLRSFVDTELLAAGDRARITELAQGPARGLALAEIPSFSSDVYDLNGLKRIIEHLFPSAHPALPPDGGPA